MRSEASPWFTRFETALTDTGVELRIVRAALWATVVVLGVLTAAGGAADATEAPKAPFVTCTTPVVTEGAVATSSARAERGATLTPSRPGETCVTTLDRAVPTSSNGVIDELRALVVLKAPTAEGRIEPVRGKASKWLG